MPGWWPLLTDTCNRVDTTPPFALELRLSLFVCIKSQNTFHHPSIHAFRMGVCTTSTTSTTSTRSTIFNYLCTIGNFWLSTDSHAEDLQLTWFCLFAFANVWCILLVRSRSSFFMSKVHCLAISMKHVLTCMFLACFKACTHHQLQKKSCKLVRKQPNRLNTT